ncbi:hypothetical protein LOTGIDRAFT_167793 [Lottia gigantea]|uniref:Poly [ADP-ribose] polymerase n=1 Tax=Lottia gigantea TaxID=225164 RepID=V4B9W4_LOTGI|nr:hypothetical protein LOTGIDRAFT_167793 [Lottia gigantea]ESO85814.1 hypothetical protein LOTGIDRAFT_167793 [Lottia gigantea]
MADEETMLQEVMQIILEENDDSMYFWEIKQNYTGQLPLKLYTIKSYPFLFEISQDRRGHIVTIVAQTKICPDYSTPSGCQHGNCWMFHICKFYILSKSCFHKSCRFGHSLKSEHNRQLLRLMSLDHHYITKNQLRMLFRRLSCRTRGSVPVPCNQYNWKNSCKRDDKCHNLHICKYLLLGGCKYGDECNKNHSIYSENVEFALNRYGITVPKSLRAETFMELKLINNAGPSCPPQENDVGDVHKVYKRQSKTILLFEFQPSYNICIYYLGGSCRFKERCRNIHVESSYQWQWIPDSSRGDEWENLPTGINHDFEICYCNLQELISFLSPDTGITYSIDLDYLEENDVGFRRVATVDLTPGTSLFCKPWATKWIWYWLDNDGKWIEYGQKGSLGHFATVISQDIETAYNENVDFSFTTQDTERREEDHQRYILDFNRMKQINAKYGTQRKIKRRPEFVDDSVIQKRKDECNRRKKFEKLNIPSNWSHTPNEDIYSHFRVEELNPTSEEYLSIKQSIVSGNNVVKNISSIKRIENVELWTAFCAEKAILDRKLQRDVPIQRLYHGTENSIIEAICRQGFDCRLSGSRVGHLYGKGGYFGINCDVSCNYCDDNNMLFIVQAVVGDYTVGCEGYLRPPLKNPYDRSSALYDACVDNMKSPSMFVLFNNRQVYPEYLVRFTR